MSTKKDILSVGPSQPEIIGLPTGTGLDFCERVEDRNSRRAEDLRKSFFCHVINVSVPMQFLDDLVDLCLCGFHHRCSERLVVLSDLELHFGLLY